MKTYVDIWMTRKVATFGNFHWKEVIAIDTVTWVVRTLWDG